MRNSFLGVLLALVLAGPLAAQDTPLKRLDTGEQSRGWEAVGRLDLGGRGFCTGALIAPDLVLTAAHCLFDKTTGARLDPYTFEFLAGFRNGRAEAYRNVARAVAHPDYQFDGAVAAARVRNDIALLQLDRPIRNTSVIPYETAGRPGKGDQVGVVSYARDRAEAPSLQELCGVIGRQEGVLVMSCDVDFGSSGAPIFSFSSGQARIVSVVSAKADMRGTPVALGTQLGQPLAELRAALDADTGVFLKAENSSSFLQTGTRRDTGAKFLRP